ncbi:MAG TPA: hypothetical protein VG652_11060 [Gaiellaceae bacterium]|nr:hypothetical protein [Gaiellaceae bacterium]
MSFIAETGAYRVVPDVETRIGEVLVVAQHPREESILEEVADAFVAVVEPLGVEPVDSVQASGEPFEVCLHDQVVVVAHQAIGVTSPLPAMAETTREGYKKGPIGVIEEDLGLVHTAGRDVVNAITRQR